MKQITLIMVAVISMSFGYFTNTEEAIQKFPVMKFDKVEHDFGSIKKGTHVETEFTFTNTGTAPLIITDARSSCGCTVPEKPAEPILPGQKSKIKVSFNGAGFGKITKVVTLTANTKSKTETVSIKANVLE